MCDCFWAISGLSGATLNGGASGAPGLVNFGIAKISYGGSGILLATAGTGGIDGLREAGARLGGG